MKESKVRKQWLRSFITMICVNVGIFSLAALVADSAEESMVCLRPIFALMIGAVISYHCAYLKRGTKWLLYLLICMPVAKIVDLISVFNDGLPKDPIETIFTLVFFSISLSVSIWYWINCLRYRDENLRLMYQGSITTPEQAMENVKNLKREGKL